MLDRLSFADISYLIERIAAVPSYTIYGVASGNLLVYSSTEGGYLDLYVFDVEKGCVRRVAEKIHLYAASSPESGYIVYAKDVSGGFEYCRLYAVDVGRGEALDISGSAPPQRVTGLAFSSGIAAWSGGTREYAGIYVAKLGGEPELVVKTLGREFVVDVSDRYVVGFGHLRGDPFSTELFILNIDTGEYRVYTPREGSSNVNPKISGGRILFASDYEDLDRQRLYTLDIESGALSRATASWRDLDEYSPVEYVDYNWLDSSSFWAIGKRKGESRLFVNGRAVGPRTGFVSSASVFGGVAYIVHSSLKTPPHILSIDIEAGSSATLIEGRLPEDISKRLGGIRYAEVESFDGLKIPVYILESAEAPKPGPTVLYPHGGPWSEVANAWSPIAAALAALGYHVIAPNFRGSTGYGQKFRKMDIGDPGGADMEDVEAAAKWAIESGLARKDLLAVAGYSYGGYTTLMQLTRKPDVWRCGVAGAPVADWEEMYELADAYFKKFEEILFAGRRELFRERSPITYIENIKAPLCIVQPQNDSRTPLKPVLKFVQRLMELGKTFELHIIPEIGHAIGLDRKSLASFLLYTALFLEKYLKQPQR